MRRQMARPLGHPFRLGQRVRMTDRAREQGLVWRGIDRGTVVGYGTTPLRVWVQRDGLKRVTSYHVIFWRPVKGQR
jgi:hypothetical protein